MRCLCSSLSCMCCIHTDDSVISNIWHQNFCNRPFTVITFYPQIHLQPVVTARVGVALPGGCESLLQSDWWRRVLHLWQLFLERTRTHTRSKGLRKTRGHVRFHSGFMWQLHFPNHVSKKKKKKNVWAMSLESFEVFGSEYVCSDVCWSDARECVQNGICTSSGSVPVLQLRSVTKLSLAYCH